MMTPAERKSYDAAISAVHAMHKYWLSIRSACEGYDRGEPDTPGNSCNIDRYAEVAAEKIEEAIRLHDELLEVSG